MFFFIMFLLYYVIFNFHTLQYREALPLFRVWKSLQRFIRAKVPHEGSHWGKALPLHRVWKELQEVVSAFNTSEGKASVAKKNYTQVSKWDMHHLGAKFYHLCHCIIKDFSSLQALQLSSMVHTSTDECNL